MSKNEPSEERIKNDQPNQKEKIKIKTFEPFGPVRMRLFNLLVVAESVATMRNWSGFRVLSLGFRVYNTSLERATCYVIIPFKVIPGGV